MKSHFGITIPTKPYLARYLEALYGSPIVFSTGNYFGTSLLGYLNTRLYVQTESVTYQKFNNFNTPLTVLLPRYWLTARQYKTELTQGNVIYLNKHFEEKFDEDLTRHCQTMKLLGMQFKNALESFCVLYNIEIDVDITYDNLKQKEFRQRSRAEERKKKQEENVSKFVLSTQRRRNPTTVSTIYNPFNLPIDHLFKAADMQLKKNDEKKCK